jgi:hypothetical protein
MELVYELECDALVWPPPLQSDDDVLEYDDFQLIFEQPEHWPEPWFDQPDDVIAGIDDVVIATPKPWLARAMFVLGALVTVAACLATK